MVYTYTAVITPEGGKYYVRVPDINGCVTTGRTVEDAIAQIADAFSAPSASRSACCLFSLL